MDSGDWPPFGEQDEFGIEFVLRKDKTPFAIVFEYLSADAEFNYFGREQSSTTELGMGLRLEIEPLDRFIPYAEAGIAHVTGEVDLSGFEFDPGRVFSESAFGGWVSAGVTWTRDDGFGVGFKLKKTVARADLPSGRTVDLGGIHYMLSVGFSY